MNLMRPETQPEKQTPWFIINFLHAGMPMTATKDELRVVEDADLIHHFKVMRLQVGDLVTLIDEVSGEGIRTQLHNMTKQSMTFRLIDTLPSPKPRQVELTLAVAVLKQAHWDWVLQKATEMGVYQIIPLQTQRTVVKVTDKNAKVMRWREIIRHAAQQSERRRMPYIYPPCNLEELVQLDKTLSVSHRWAALERSKEGFSIEALKNDVKTQSKPTSVLLAIGPEGGWADIEAEYLVAKGFEPVSFGDTIFRSDTAAIYATALIHHAAQTCA